MKRLTFLVPAECPASNCYTVFTPSQRGLEPFRRRSMKCGTTRRGRMRGCACFCILPRPRRRAAALTAAAAKAASGAAEAVPYLTVIKLARALRALKNAGIQVIGTADDATTSLFDIQLDGALALVMGAEGAGMRRLTREACDEVVRIPL